MDDVMFGRNGREGSKGWSVWRCVASGTAIPGQSLMSMNALLLLCLLAL